jgi:DNA polymerase/3'-5' exonuclease PolX
VQVKLLVHARGPSFFKTGEAELALKLVQGDKEVPVPKNLAHLCAVLGVDPLTQALEATEELARRRATTLVEALVEHEIERERLLLSWQGFGESAGIELSFVADEVGQPDPHVGLRRITAFGGSYEAP